MGRLNKMNSWTPYQTRDGQVYFVNPRTGETSWQQKYQVLENKSIRNKRDFSISKTINYTQLDRTKKNIYINNLYSENLKEVVWPSNNNNFIPNKEFIEKNKTIYSSYNTPSSQMQSHYKLIDEISSYKTKDDFLKMKE